MEVWAKYVRSPEVYEELVCIVCVVTLAIREGAVDRYGDQRSDAVQAVRVSAPL